MFEINDTYIEMLMPECIKSAVRININPQSIAVCMKSQIIAINAGAFSDRSLQLATSSLYSCM